MTAELRHQTIEVSSDTYRFFLCPAMSACLAENQKDSCSLFHCVVVECDTIINIKAVRPAHS